MIEFYMEYLERNVIPPDAKIHLLRPGMVQLIRHSQDTSHLVFALPPHLERYQAIFIPVNDSRPQLGNMGSHWSLLVFVRPAAAFYHYDSLHHGNIHEARMTTDRIAPLLQASHHLITMPTPNKPMARTVESLLLQLWTDWSLSS
ncbi:hypothetical protein BCR43DRAFT_564293 [Syncephalastrum racemosum]|uniref:Ubiquitin-like protease family profile domain-containing protein n=1 Tax=Syncephalastrum racemosum TaxID=13706 RepID=A0A1X2H9R4_SYNRA|nr:hypothetical protein BCR43DRAFT_564293 [Syncephalastrum racemosum]